jgi:lipopolysaccharide/colanic/teichoic acid biosynthesis glycosyltransferase
MATAFRPRTLVLFVGDLLSFVIALWLSLFFRAFEVPSQELFLAHLEPFSLLFVAWVAVFFIAGLYENRSLILARRALSTTLLIAQTFNMALAALFFFFAPLFGIAPKTLLVIYLAVSFLVTLLWRVGLFPLLRSLEAAVVVGEGAIIDELVRALGAAHRSPVRVTQVLRPNSPTLAEDVRKAIDTQQARAVIADWSDPRVAQAFPRLDAYLARGIRFFDATALYEEVFGRISLARLNDRWFAGNVSRHAHASYDTLKRAMDICIALPLGLISLVLYPFIALAIKLEDGGSVFVSLPRVGESDTIIYIKKFRSMTGNDAGDYGKTGASKLSVTQVGKILRDLRLDEFPQLWGVVRGDLSLIGPRPETPSLVEIYEKEIPYYGMRHLIKPGLSGWAQLYHDNHPHAVTDVAATQEKLSYDFYYLKHRSLVLDAAVALKTIKKLLTRSGV